MDRGVEREVWGTVLLVQGVWGTRGTWGVQEGALGVISCAPVIERYERFFFNSDTSIGFLPLQ